MFSPTTFGGREVVGVFTIAVRLRKNEVILSLSKKLLVTTMAFARSNKCLSGGFGMR